MRFANLYRISFYLMLLFASLVLSIDSPDNKYAMAYPMLVGLSAVVAFLTVDRNRALAVSDVLLNFLAVGSVGLAFLEYSFDSNALLLSAGHWLIYLQIILMFRPKSVQEDWEMFILGLVQVMVGTVISQTDAVGAMLFFWAILALWVLGLFSLQRDALRAGGATSRTEFASRGELYPGLFNFPFLLSGFRVTMTTLALGGIIFLAMPRRLSMSRARGGESSGQHMTGFDDEVQLGQLGEILENDSVVMTVEMLDENGDRFVPNDEPLWRGVTMAIYERGRWHRQRPSPGSFPITLPKGFLNRDPHKPRGFIRQQIKLEANDSSVLFALRPMRDASTPRRLGPDLNQVDGTLSRLDTRPGSFDYEVRSYRDTELPQVGESLPNAHRKYLLLGIPDAIRDRIGTIAKAVIEEKVPKENRGNQRACARALESYLRDSGRFGYTLKLDLVDPILDPIEDFLVNRREGHCEYFASSLTLLLRSVGIPARMVNGFKGGDWNDLAKVMSVRQKHAHSWVEAYLGDSPEVPGLPLWLTLDPTPGGARDASVARVGGFKANFRQISDFIRYIWVFYIVGYNAQRQESLIYGPIRKVASEAKRGFSVMAEEAQKLRVWAERMLHFPNVRAFISVRGFLVSFLGLLILAGLFRSLGALLRRIFGWARVDDDRSGSLPVGAAQYRRLALLLSSYGLERPPAETQEEFARRATLFLTSRGSNTEAVADVPRQVVEAFYRVRFGSLDLNPRVVDKLESRLNDLDQCLNASQA